jgi:DNA polymerase-2
MWITRAGADEQEYEQLALDVGRIVGIDLSLEGIYNWILFPASKMDPRLPTANRYVGWYTSGEIKIRGVEMRRRDTPVFLKRMQGEMLQLMGRARTVGELREMLPQLLAKAKEWMEILRSGAADPHELVVRRRLSREAGEYTTRTANAVVARALEEAGVRLAAGESVEYIVVDASGKRKPEKAKPLALYALDDGYDIEYYTAMALKTAETLLLPFGYDTTRLGEVMGIPPVRRAPRPARRAPAAQQELFLDFPPAE